MGGSTSCGLASCTVCGAPASSSSGGLVLLDQDETALGNLGWADPDVLDLSHPAGRPFLSFVPVPEVCEEINALLVSYRSLALCCCKRGP